MSIKRVTRLFTGRTASEVEAYYEFQIVYRVETQINAGQNATNYPWDEASLVTDAATWANGNGVWFPAMFDNYQGPKIAGQPLVPQSYPAATGCFCVKRDCAVDQDDATVFLVTCHFTSSVQDVVAKAIPVVSWDVQKVQRQVYGAYACDRATPYAPAGVAGNIPSIPVVTTAGEMFNPIPMANYNISVVSIQFWTRNWNNAFGPQYTDAVATDVVFGQPANTVRVEKLTATQKFLNYSNIVWDIHMELHIDLQGWMTYLFNVGYRERGTMADGVTRGWKMILDAQAHPVSAPWPLDVNGVAYPRTGNIVAPILIGYQFHRLVTLRPFFNIYQVPGA